MITVRSAQYRYRPRVEQLELRRLMAVVAYQLAVYTDQNGVPGEVLASPSLKAGDTFFVRITAQEFDPLRTGIQTASVDLKWDAAMLEVIESDFRLDHVITNHLPLFQQGELDNDLGHIRDLSGTASLVSPAGRPIGNARPETFAMIRMRVKDNDGTVNLELQRSQGIETATVPMMLMYDSAIRLDSEAITIAPRTEPASDPSSNTSIAMNVNEPSEERASETVSSVLISKLVTSDTSEIELTIAAEIEADRPTNSVKWSFDANGDGVFDLADFGVLNVMASKTSEITQESASSAVSIIDALSNAPMGTDTTSLDVNNEVIRLCTPAPSDPAAIEAWLNSLASAWIADAEARERRRRETMAIQE